MNKSNAPSRLSFFIAAILAAGLFACPPGTPTPVPLPPPPVMFG